MGGVDSITMTNPADTPQATQYVRVALRERVAGQPISAPVLRLFDQVLKPQEGGARVSVRTMAFWCFAGRECGGTEGRLADSFKLFNEARDLDGATCQRSF
jgi:hypothetical protein